MKKYIALLILVAVQFPAITQAAIFHPLVTINPNPPLRTTNQISAILTGQLSTPGYSRNTSISISGNNIQINLNVSSPVGIQPQILSPFSENVNIGMLNAGNYTLTTNFIEDGIIRHTLTRSLSVSSVSPVPTISQWGILILTMLIGCIAYSWRLNRSIAQNS